MQSQRSMVQLPKRVLVAIFEYGCQEEFDREDAVALVDFVPARTRRLKPFVRPLYEVCASSHAAIKQTPSLWITKIKIIGWDPELANQLAYLSRFIRGASNSDIDIGILLKTTGLKNRLHLFDWFRKGVFK